MRFLPFALASLLAAPLTAASVAYCDLGATPVVGRVIAYETSVNTTQALLDRHGVDVVINPDVSALIAGGVPMYYWRCTATPTVVEMGAGNKATVDAYFASQGETSAEATCKLSVAIDPQIRAAFLVVLEEWVNPLRALHSLAAITKQEAKADYDAKCEEILGGGGEVIASAGGQKATRVAGGGSE